MGFLLLQLDVGINKNSSVEGLVLNRLGLSSCAM